VNLVADQEERSYPELRMRSRADLREVGSFQDEPDQVKAQLLLQAGTEAEAEADTEKSQSNNYPEHGH